MKPDDLTRGKLLCVAASLFFFLSGEILKWQNPVLAAGEALARIEALRRAHDLQSVS